MLVHEFKERSCNIGGNVLITKLKGSKVRSGEAVVFKATKL